MTKIENNRTLITLILSFVAVSVYVISLKVAYPLFQNTRLADPLASLHVLFPLYYVAIILAMSACLLRFVSKTNSRALDLWLLVLFALMLWYTPYALAGATYQLDGLRFIGVSEHVPELLKGEPVISTMANYGRHHPTSFIFHWIFIRVIGIGPTCYMNIFFPLLYLCLFVMLYYLFPSKLFNDRVAFFSLLLGIPGLHYVQLHISPHTVAVLITVTAMVLLLKRSTASIIALVVAIVAVVISHPISPLILMVFLGSYLVVNLLKERGKYPAVLAAVTVVCFLGWLMVRLFNIIPAPDSISIRTTAATGADLVKSLMPGDFPRTTKYLFGTAFVYSPIHTLNKSIYFIYAAVAAVVTVWALTANLLRLKSVKTWVMGLGGLSRSQWFLLIATPVLLILTVLLGEYELGEYGLTERSLTFIILTLSAIIASILLKSLSSEVLQRAKTWFCVVLVVILTLSFPVVSYSKDAYTSIPESELSAAGFVESHKLVVVKPVDGQEIIFPGFQPAGWNWDTKKLPLQYNSVMFRSTGYYYHAMRTELSFSDNEFVQARETFINGNEYNKIYSSPTTEIFLEKGTGD